MHILVPFLHIGGASQIQTQRGFPNPLYRGDSVKCLADSYTHIHIWSFFLQILGMFNEWTIYRRLHTHIHISVFSLQIWGCFAKPLGSSRGFTNPYTDGILWSPYTKGALPIPYRGWFTKPLGPSYTHMCISAFIPTDTGSGLQSP